MEHRFIHIVGQKEDNTQRILRQACRDRKIEYFPISAPAFDRTMPISLQKSDLLYRTATGRDAFYLERLVLNEQVTTFYRSIHHWDRYSSIPTLIRAGIPIPRTIIHVTNERSLLHHYVAALGGFPVIVKVIGNSHGIGVMKVDSLSALFSLVDFLIAKEIYFVLRKYIPIQTSARLIVLGDAVIDSIEYQTHTDDFRSNVGESPLVQPKIFSTEVQNIAIQATHAIGLEFAGVDILIDHEEIFVIEVNFPCYFLRAQFATGTDIAGLMVDYLIEKSSRKE